MTQLLTIDVPNLSSRLSLRRNFTWTFAGNMVYAASQWGVLVVLAKLGSPEVVGQFALGLAVCAPVILFANLQLRSVQATDARREYTFADYLGLRLMTTLAAYLGIIAIVLLSGYRQETALVILLIGLAKSFEAISDVIFGLLQQHERMDRIAKSLMIEGPVTLVVMAVVMALTGSVVWAVASMAAAWGLQLALYNLGSARLILRGAGEGSEWRRLRPRFHLGTLRRLGWLALPLGFAGTLSSLNLNIPRYFIGYFEGEHQLGIFATIAALPMVGVLIINALGLSAGPRLAQYFRNGDWQAFRRLRNQLVGIGALVGMLGIVGVLVVGVPVLNLLYSPEYAEAADVLLILMVAGALQFSYIFLGSALSAMWNFSYQAYVQVISIVAVVLLCFILVEPYGIRGAAYAILFKSVFEGAAYIVALVYSVRRHQQPSIQDVRKSS